MRVLNFLNLSDAKIRQNPLSAVSLLTGKELIVAILASRGLLNKEIAEEVNLSESRIKTCLSGIYKKLGITENDDKRKILTKKLKL